MTAQFFLDTNVLLYAASRAPADVLKRDTARNLLLRQDLGISVQVLQEFYHAAIRKTHLGLSPAESLALVHSFAVLTVLPISREIVLAGIEKSQRYKISYWDSAILAAAQALGATTVFSEDFNHGQIYDGVTVLNPFLPGAELPA